MSYVMFLVTEIIGVLILFFTYKGVFDLVMAFLTVILMLGLSFHVLVRRPDGTSIRMACFTTALWYFAVGSGKLFLEFRGWQITSGAFIFCLLALLAAGFSTYALIQRPTDLDLEA